MTLRRLATVAVVLAGLVRPVAGGLSQDYAHWADGPAGFLLTKAERRAWTAIHDDGAAADFIALFWARRDPNLATMRNEAYEQFLARVAYADEHFATDSLRGALTDRGRLLIVLGVPYRVERRGPTRVVESIDHNTDGTDRTWGSVELWEYLPAELPVAVKGPLLQFVLFERRRGSDDYVIDRTHPESALALTVLARAPAALVVNPNLRRPPLPSPRPDSTPVPTPAGAAPRPP